MNMKKIASLALVALLAAVLGFGQERRLETRIDFEFTAGGKAFPAGAYTFLFDEAAMAFRMSDGGKNTALIPVATRIATFAGRPSPEGYIVFDVAGDKHILSEIWLVGVDGYLVAATREAHKHRTVPGKR